MLGPNCIGFCNFADGVSLTFETIAPEAIAVVCPSLERFRAPLETVLGWFAVWRASKAAATKATRDAAAIGAGPKQP